MFEDFALYAVGMDSGVVTEITRGAIMVSIVGCIAVLVAFLYGVHIGERTK